MTTTDSLRLTTRQMAEFAAKGYLRLDSVVPDALNQAFLSEIGHTEDVASVAEHYDRIMGSSAIPIVPSGTPLAHAYPQGSALGRIIDLPAVRGAIESLVGPTSRIDHHFLHITFPPSLTGRALPAQHTHQDSTIDPRRAFDVQLMYFPHAVTREMGGTRFVPGSHLRIVSEAAIGRYQNIVGQQHMVCDAGTVLIVHHGIWHGGGANRSDRLRYMFKIRLCPTQRQCRLWDTSDLDTKSPQKPTFWLGAQPDPADVHTILTRPEPWHEADTGRLEYLNRIHFWRYLTGDETFDADYWATRIENEYT
ncbi:MAG: phytanoyl-CoA dioxygenase family protein [Pseudomonadales bacterium]|nr:phytanoyl-CoA dioxygenase family protein [Pseudomonadales bacterium]